ncbi:hypothetical protein Tco_0212083 [Tanacetum coccineum]
MIKAWASSEFSRVYNKFFMYPPEDKCYSENISRSVEGLHVDDKLCFVEEPVEIMDREVKRLKQSRVYQFSRFDGTQGEVLSSHGNAKTNFKRSIRISSPNMYLRQVLQLEP